jgi:phosphohistidine swiveling domain-containing protein
VDDWQFDLPGDPEYPVYIRGQAEEVLPGVLSPMMSTLGASIVERAWRRHFVETLSIIDEPTALHTFFPIIGGRSYVNLSVSARAASLSLGVRAEDFAQQFAVGEEYVRSATERRDGDDARAARMQSVIGGLLESPPADLLAAERASALSHRSAGKLQRAGMTGLQLFERVRGLEPEAVTTLARVMLIGTMEAICFGSLERGLAAVYGDGAGALCRELLSGLGDVESAMPAQRLGELARLVGEDYRSAMSRLLEDFGFRGATEFEIAAPSWEMVPESVERLVEGVRAAPPKAHPGTSAQAAEATLVANDVVHRWPELDYWLPKMKSYVGYRERAKATFVIVFNEMRLDLVEIGRRLVATGRLVRPESVFLMSVGELQTNVQGGDAVSTVTLDERARRMDELAQLVAPSIAIVGELVPMKEWAIAGSGAVVSATDLRGVAGSPGTARGRVRVVRDPYVDTPPEPGEVLVAPFTDPGWTLMFMAAAAVVVQVGGALSHAVIVARELGIPAVVSVVDCCRVLRTGDLVEVDGSRGTVRVIERGA